MQKTYRSKLLYFFYDAIWVFSIITLLLYFLASILLIFEIPVLMEEVNNKIIQFFILTNLFMYIRGIVLQRQSIYFKDRKICFKEGLVGSITGFECINVNGTEVQIKKQSLKWPIHFESLNVYAPNDPYKGVHKEVYINNLMYSNGDFNTIKNEINRISKQNV